MNRQRRRAEKVRMQPVVRALAIHEAGHCVARVLTASSMGWDPSEVIAYIEVGSAPITATAGPLIDDRRHGLRSQVVSWGRYLSKPMEEFVAARGRMSHAPGDHATADDDSDLGLLFAEMRAAGYDIDGWFRAKSLIAFFGPMAEAKLLEKPFNDIWNNNPFKDDKLGLMRAGVLCGMTPEQISIAASENANIAEQDMARPEVWRAITTLADNLKTGRMSGREAATIIMSVLETR
jgi:hypothetical protein